MPPRNGDTLIAEGINRETTRASNVYKKSNTVPRFPLRPYQTQARDASIAAYARGVHRHAIQIPTGGGKTIIFAHLIANRGGRALVLAHRDELIEQAVEKLLMVAPGLDVGVVKAERNETDAGVIVASIQTLARERRVEQMPRDFTTVVVDEAHHAAAATYRRVLDHVVGPNTLLLGVSATLDRADRVGPSTVFDEIVYECTILDLITAGYLSDIKALQIGIEANFAGLHKRHGDFIDSEVETMLRDADAPSHAVAAYEEHAPGRKAIVFAPTVQSAKDFAAAFQDVGHPVGVVYGAMPTEDRKDTLKRFKAGEIRVLANCMVLTECYDEPSVDCIVVARPTCSRSLYVQMIGRGTRTFPGKEDLLVLDLVGGATRHELVTAASLFGLDPEVLAVKGLTEAEAEKREAEAAIAEAGRIVARQVDLFRRRDLHWVIGENLFTLSAGNAGQLIVSQQQDGWRVEVVNKDSRERLIGGLDQGYAMGYAEDFARKSGAGALIDPAAAWRQRPPSEKQIATMRKMRLAWTTATTQGEASDMIAATIAAWKVQP